MVSSAITPARTIAILVGIAAVAVVGFAIVREGVSEPEAIQGAAPVPSSEEVSVMTPPPSPTPLTPGQIKERNIAEAKERLEEYYVTTAQVANEGYVSWNKELKTFWGHPDLWGPLGASYADLASQGKYTTGAAAVESMLVTDYENSEQGGFEEVSLSACIDFSQVRNFAASGEEIPRSVGAPKRYQFEYVIAHQGIGSIWTINDQVPHPEVAC